MSILPQALEQFLGQLGQRISCHFLPGSCLLCGTDSAQALLCPDCHAELPILSEACCPQCAEPCTDGERCAACRKEAPFFDATIAHFCYEFPVDRIIQALKYGHQLAIAPWLGELLAGHAGLHGHDLLLALPLHPQRLQERGFNQSIEIARRISRHTGQRLHLDILKRLRATPPQAELSFKARQANVRGAFECLADLNGQAVLLIDDVMTTGATLNECARVLKLHGARKVTVAVAARALRRNP